MEFEWNQLYTSLPHPFLFIKKELNSRGIVFVFKALTQFSEHGLEDYVIVTQIGTIIQGIIEKGRDSDTVFLYCWQNQRILWANLWIQINLLTLSSPMCFAPPKYWKTNATMQKYCQRGFIWVITPYNFNNRLKS